MKQRKTYDNVKRRNFNKVHDDFGRAIQKRPKDTERREVAEVTNDILDNISGEPKTMKTKTARPTQPTSG